MISLGDLLVFLGAVGVTVVYVAVLHHFISRSEQFDSADDSQDRDPRSTKH